MRAGVEGGERGQRCRRKDLIPAVLSRGKPKESAT